MGRPCKAVSTKSGAISKAEEETRQEIEKAIGGKKDKVSRATMPLSKNQKKIRKNLVKELGTVLTNVDCYILDQCCIDIDRLQNIEEKINENPELIKDKALISAKKQYFSEFVRLCTELSMSPQSRAKIANSFVGKETENPLLKLMSDDD